MQIALREGRSPTQSNCTRVGRAKARVCVVGHREEPFRALHGSSLDRRSGTGDILGSASIIVIGLVKMPDRLNSVLARRMQTLVDNPGKVGGGPYTYLKALTVDNDHARTWYPDRFRMYGIETLPAVNDGEALALLKRTIEAQESLDVITTDLVHEPLGGFRLIEHVRSLSEELVTAGGLRVRHVPIVVITCCSSKENGDRLRLIDPTVVLKDKFHGFSEIAQAVDDAVCNYRASLLDELQYVGLSVVWEGGRFSFLSCYAHTAESAREGKYFAGPTSELSQGFSRLVLISERLSVAERSVAELEHLLNVPATREGDLHRFFERHPEFLYRGNYISHWSEPVLESDEASLRPDFVLKPKTLSEDPYEWEVLDLKRQDVVLATAHRHHPDLSAAVYHGCAQLRNYKRYFEDPRNRDK